MDNCVLNFVKLYYIFYVSGILGNNERWVRLVFGLKRKDRRKVKCLGDKIESEGWEMG